jgi:uncharacterized protein (DUF305 family)
MPTITPPHQRRRRTPRLGAALATGLLATALGLTACGGGHDGANHSAPVSSAAVAAGPAAAGPHNDADVAFATGMIPHHAQAIEMADLAVQRSASAPVKDLAVKIKAAQAPEIAQLSGWLGGWGKPVPATGGSMAMDHGSGQHAGMVGMMSQAEMDALAKASGAAFDTLWLQMMIKHHEGAVTMAKTQLAGGENPATKELAQAIISSQSAEITTMKQLLTP